MPRPKRRRSRSRRRRRRTERSGRCAGISRDALHSVIAAIFSYRPGSAISAMVPSGERNLTVPPGIGVGIRQDFAAIRPDPVENRPPVRDCDAEMMDRRTGADQLRLGVVLAVVQHQREIDIAVGQVARYVAARAPGFDLAEAEHVLVEPGRGFEIGDFQRDVIDARLGGGAFRPGRCASIWARSTSRIRSRSRRRARRE